MKAICPESKALGRPVKPVTVESLVNADLRATVGGRSWSYCADPSCDVVYFSDDGAKLVKSDLTVRVGAKETTPPRLVCYCFGHTRESIRDDVLRTGTSSVVESVAARVQAGDCSCETKNPKGSCCLGDLRRAIEEAQS
ncbi:MAG: (2Fe-2S)-binding protein [Planctomycetota bacterium]